MKPDTNHPKESSQPQPAALSPDWTVGTLRDSADTLDLRYAHAPRDLLGVKKFLAFSNGRTEWIEKYSYLLADLQLDPECGFVTWDHRGQGASGGARAFVDSYKSYGQDAARILQHVAGERPYALLAHSMGGLIALHATLLGLVAPKALILCSPLLALPNLPLPRYLSRPLAKFLSDVKLAPLSTGGGNHTRLPFQLNHLTHSVERYERMRHCPYPVGSATFGWVNQTFKALDDVFNPNLLARLNVPTLVLGGGAECVVDPEGFQAWVKVASQHAKAPVELVLIPEARHELLSEVPKYYDLTLRQIRRWLKESRFF